MAAYLGIAAHFAYDMFSRYQYLSVILVFSPPIGLWNGNFFLIAPFPDHCLLVPFFYFFKLSLTFFCFCRYTGMSSIVRIITSGVREGKFSRSNEKDESEK